MTGKEPITKKEPSYLIKEPITSLTVKNCYVAGPAVTEDSDSIQLYCRTNSVA